MSDHSHLGELRLKSTLELVRQLKEVLGAQRLARNTQSHQALTSLLVDENLIFAALIARWEEHEASQQQLPF